MRKRKKLIKCEDCHTDAQKLAYSRQQYDLYAAIGHGKPSDILDLEKFPMETEDWHNPEYWIMRAKAEREKRRLLRGK
jgi:hypothetical protein